MKTITTRSCSYVVVFGTNGHYSIAYHNVQTSGTLSSLRVNLFLVEEFCKERFKKVDDVSEDEYLLFHACFFS